VEHMHTQTDDAPCQLNRRFSHYTVLKWKQLFWVCWWESCDAALREFLKVTGCLSMETCSSFVI